MSQSPEMPLRIGEYVVTGVLGQGGMGRVYEARDERLDRVVAIKVLLRSVTSEPGMADRFLREARAMAKVSSPHVVTIFHVGEIDGAPFLVMERLDGEDLSSVLTREHRLPWRDAVAVALDAAAGLRAAAQVGLVHRDVKPANLFLVDKRVKVTDFGLARPLDGSANLTQAGLVVGTPYYLAPELARGAPASIASDVYALGATLYEMVCGQPPFGGDSAMAVLTAHITERAAPLSSFVHDAPEGLQRLVDKMMAKSPEARFADHALLEDALRAVVSAPAPPQIAASSGIAATALLPRTGGPPTLSPPTPAVSQALADASALPPRASGPVPTVRTETLAIMFTDIAGYTERTGQQSREEAARWLALHDGLLLPVVRAFRGTVVKTIGDALLVTFRSPTDAVLCGCAIQDRLFAHNQSASATDRIDVRVAVSAGEVRVQRGDIFGEAVNLAARLEGLAERGEVLISDAVFSTMNNAEVKTASRGEHSFKGISRSVHVYAAVPDGGPGEAPFGNRALARVTTSTSGLMQATAGARALAERARAAVSSIMRAAPALAMPLRALQPVVARAPKPVLALAPAALLLVVVGAAVAMRPSMMKRIERGEATLVIEELEAKTTRDGDEERLLAYAYRAEKRIDDALDAFARAAQKGEVDRQGVATAITALDAQQADAAKEALTTWPDKAVSADLKALAMDGTWYQRHHALDVLEARKEDGDVDVQAFALKDLEEGSSCQRRRMGLNLLKRIGKGQDAQKAVQRAARRMPDNACMMFDTAGAEAAIKKR